MLQGSWVVPGNVVRNNPCEQHHSNADESQIHSGGLLVIGSHHDVVHVARETGHDDQRDVNDKKCQKAEHREEVDRTR